MASDSSALLVLSMQQVSIHTHFKPRPTRHDATEVLNLLVPGTRQLFRALHLLERDLLLAPAMGQDGVGRDVAVEELVELQCFGVN